MTAPYIPHYFGEAVERKLRSRMGWLTAGVASSVPWPKDDVWVRYDGEDYIIRGTEQNGKPSPPCISVACDRVNVDDALSKVYRFTSIIGWFNGGYVDISGYTHGSHPILYGDPRNVFSTIGVFGKKAFDCNHMPLVRDEDTRKALAFYREGRRLQHVHDSYAFLSFYKVIESQFADGRQKGAWIDANLDALTDNTAARVAELRANGLDVGMHLFESGRCAVAHATAGKDIVDPDIPSDRRRLSADLDVIAGLARLYILKELQVPDAHESYRVRDRLEPWSNLMDSRTLQELREGKVPATVDGLQGQKVAVGLWPDGAVAGLEDMTMHMDAIGPGVVRVVLFNPRMTICLVFVLDFKNGRIHTQLEDGGMCQTDKVQPDETDVRAYATYFHRVIGNAVAELAIGGLEPVDCEVVIPVNIIPQNPDTAIEEAVERFRQSKAGQ
jgi:hypothetical protein